MRRHIYIMLLVVAVLTLTRSVFAEQTMQFGEDSTIRMIRPVGEDGGMFYVVYCKNGHKGSVEVYDDPKQVCIGPPKRCMATWSLLPAAEELCR